jgi:type IV pilus assembly protein PilE
MVMQQRNKGMTLIEVMVVVVIVGILAAIAYPSYRRQVMRSNRTEAKVALMQTAQALEKCFTRFMSYNNAGCPASTQFNAGASFNTPDGNYRITGAFPSATTYNLTATAIGGQVGDAQCLSFGLNQVGLRSVTGPGPVETCW